MSRAHLRIVRANRGEEITTTLDGLSAVMLKGRLFKWEARSTMENQVGTSEVLIRRHAVVNVHLNALDELLCAPRPGIAEALRASLSLRILFDGILAQVAHEYGQELSVEAPDLTDIPIDQALLFACGGYSLGANSVNPYYLYREPGTHSLHRAQFERQVASSPRTHRQSQIKFSKFMDQKCLGFAGFSMSRNETIRYVANKCGGAHHHDDQERFNQLEQQLTNIGNSLRVGGEELSVVFLETLGTASILLASSSVRSLRNAIPNGPSPAPTAS